MKIIWYVHRWFGKQYRGCKFHGTDFDAADRYVAEMLRMHSSRGWRYEITGSREMPHGEFKEIGAGI